jgi:hypothetical protein
MTTISFSLVSTANWPNTVALALTNALTKCVAVLARQACSKLRRIRLPLMATN